jgi:hypothetical protein
MRLSHRGIFCAQSQRNSVDPIAATGWQFCAEGGQTRKFLSEKTQDKFEANR